MLNMFRQYKLLYPKSTRAFNTLSMCGIASTANIWMMNKATQGKSAEEQMETLKHCLEPGSLKVSFKAKP